MSQQQIDMLQRALAREKGARKQAEKILENKAAELYEAKQKLELSYLKQEALLNRKDSQLQGVFENIVDAYVIMDLMGNILKMNDAAIKLLGFEDANVDFNLMNLIAPCEVNRVVQSFTLLLKKGTITDFHLNIITRKKEERLVHINASIIYDNGVPVAAQGIVRDITLAKQNEEQLIESENRLATLILNLDSGILVEDENRKIVLTNTKFCEFFSIAASPEALIGMDCSDAAKQNRMFFKKPELFVTRIDDILKQKKQVLGDELEMVNGNILLRDYIPIYKNNIYKGHLWSYKDVTLRRKYRRSIEAQKQKYSNIIANMNLGLVEVNNDDEILMVNQSFIEMSGYSESELIGSVGSDVFPDEISTTTIQHENIKRLKGEFNSYELKVKNKQGEDRHWLVSSAPNYNLDGKVVGGIGIHLDITDIKSLELQKEKLLSKLEKSNDELQEYAHIVSHDLKSPLRSINALVSWIKEDNAGKLDDASLQNFALIETTLEKMEQLISDVLNYSSVGFTDCEKVPVNLDKLIKDLVQIMYTPKHIKIEFLNTLPTVKGDIIKLQQVFQNLIGNAIKFIDKEAGFIRISVIELSTHYKFSIADNGMGIDPKFHDKIFKIFHTLNKSKDSTGIGLSIVKKIIGLHDGDIWLESEPKKGTTFIFTLKK